MRFISIVGARPQFIKAAVVSNAIRERSSIEHLLVHTGQHYDEDLSARFFSDLGLDNRVINLNIGSGSHGAQTGRMLESIEEVLIREPSDWIILYGDTNSTLAGALAAAKLRRRAAHVEAGVRSFDRGMPEEINRVVTDRLSDILFAPTETGVTNLRAEGVDGARIRFVGDVMYDATRLYDQSIRRSSILATLGLEEKEFALATIHRAENTDDRARLGIIMDALCEISQRLCVVLPLHPRTRAVLECDKELLDRLAHFPSLRITKPLGYFDLSALERSAQFIFTDSGGVQKEAYFHGTPCLILRETTEWPELVAEGASKLCPPISADAILEAAWSLNALAPKTQTLFGDGDAATRIVDALVLG